jgi:hypothetical protein
MVLALFHTRVSQRVSYRIQELGRFGFEIAHKMLFNPSSRNLQLVNRGWASLKKRGMKRWAEKWW